MNINFHHNNLLGVTDENAFDKVDFSPDVVPKKLVEKLSLPPITLGLKLLDKNERSREKISEEERRDGFIESIVESKRKQNGFSYYILKK